MPAASDQREAIAAALADLGSVGVGGAASPSAREVGVAASPSPKHQSGQAAPTTFAAAARAFFQTLGYQSDRCVRITTPLEFRERLDPHGTLTDRETEALGQLRSLHLLFQLTDTELAAHGDLFEDTAAVQTTRIESYLFFGAELPPGHYTRTALSTLVRAINKPLPMPALVLFRHGLPAAPGERNAAEAPDTVSLGIIHRRLHKRDQARDVLEKVTLIKDIRCARPHRAHVDILADLSFATLAEHHDVANFVQLHAAWQKTLNLQALNQRFYQQLQHWYFWALGHIEFPRPREFADAETYKAQSLIRLLTRLIFVWFLKEKGLVPETLFDERRLPKLLKGFAPRDPRQRGSVFYRAILQNLFFATLNQEPAQRGWARDGQNFMAHALYRYRDDFTDPATALELFQDIPFLNGGLFECLDKILGTPEKPRYLRVDGFSRRPDSQPCVPDFLFFGDDEEVDLGEFYSESKSRPARVRGLCRILNDFKFTIEENTPVEEDVALDPELLGRVFENLLAAYNPETRVTARKQTGSFYTPREIVDYMTGEALFYALREKLGDVPDAEARLRALLAHDEAPNPFSDAETTRLIGIIDSLKVLDPACGSGAFPMGILHRLVQVLGKLDPDNVKWRERQRQRALEETEQAFQIGDKEERRRRLEDINEVFDQNASGYGRKLYLIENCLYGLDLQPVAVQITKLRFFTSLVVDQKVAQTSSPAGSRGVPPPGVTPGGTPGQPAAGSAPGAFANRGIRPLPNLETNVVAANSLIGIEKRERQGDLLTEDTTAHRQLKLLRQRLTEVRHQHFLARTPKTKAHCRDEDARLRTEMSGLLEAAGLSAAQSRQLAGWDPYDQNAHADFFDPEWMFGVSGGFDVVIANPPYGAEVEPGLQRVYRDRYESLANSMDTFIMFMEGAVALLSAGSVLAYIVPSGWVSTPSCSKLRAIFAERFRPRVFASLPYDSFGSAYIDTMVVVAQRLPSGVTWTALESKTVQLVVFPIRHTIRSCEDFDEFGKTSDFGLWGDPAEDGFLVLASLEEAALVSKLRGSAACFDDYLEVMRGMEVFHPSSAAGLMVPKPAFTGDIYRYQITSGRKAFVDYTSEIEQSKPWRFFSKPRILLRQLLSRRFRLQAAATDAAFLTNQSVQSLVPRDGFQNHVPVLLAVLNSRLISWFFCQINMVARRDDFPKTIIKQTRELPLPELAQVSSDLLARLTESVARVMSAKRAIPARDTMLLERDLDQLVYCLYALTPEEIRIVEEATVPKPESVEPDAIPSLAEASADEAGTGSEPEPTNRAGRASSSIVRQSSAASPPKPPDEPQPAASDTKRQRPGALQELSPSARPVPIGETDRNEVLCTIRRLFSDGQGRDRETALGELARALGYERLGARIREVLDTDLLTAVRRGILQNDRGGLSLLCRDVEQYERDFLKEQFLASLGRGWTDREEAVRGFARWLGFARTGPRLEETARSLINGLLREGRIEADGPNLRRGGGG